MTSGAQSMRRLALMSCLLAIASAASAAPSLGGPRLGEARKDRFPERSFILTLPKPAELLPGSVAVLENGAPVSDLTVTPTSALKGGGGAVVLVIDTSNSMRGRPIEAAVDAARAFAARRNTNQSLAIVTFDRRPRVRLELTNDADVIAAALAARPPLAEGTRFYDAVGRAIQLLQQSRAQTRAVVLLSDGADTGSNASADEVIAAAKAGAVRIFTVGISAADLDSQAMRRLSEGTGATHVEASASAISSVFAALGSSLAGEYLVDYRSRIGPATEVTVAATVEGYADAATASYVSPALPAAMSTGFEPSRLDAVLQSPLLMFGVILACAGLLAYGLTTFLGSGRNPDVRRRLAEYVSLPHDEQSDRPLLSNRILGRTEQSLRRLQWWPEFKQVLDIAEIRLPAEQIVVFTVLGTIFAGWLSSTFVSPLASLLALVTVPFAVYATIKWKLDRLRRRFGDQLPDNLEVLASALRAGHSLVGAISVVVADAAEPSRREFRRALTNEQLGIPLEEALRETVVRMDNRDVEQVALVAALQRRVGGDSAEVLDRVTDTVRGRQEVRRLVRTLTAQGRLARWIVSLLPVGLFLLIGTINRPYIAELYERTAGLVLLGVAGVLIVLGSLVIKRIVEIKV